MSAFRTLLRSAPVIRVGPGGEKFTYYCLDLQDREIFVFRDMAARIERLGKSDDWIPVSVDTKGLAGLLTLMAENLLVTPRGPTEHNPRLPWFREWWDGSSSQLWHLITKTLAKYREDPRFEETLTNMVRAIQQSFRADDVIQSEGFPSSAQFAALEKTNADASITVLCRSVNEHDNCARELYTRLKYADPLIERLTANSQLERIRPAIEYVPKTFEWWNSCSGRPALLAAVKELTGVTPP